MSRLSAEKGQVSINNATQTLTYIQVILLFGNDTLLTNICYHSLFHFLRFINLQNPLATHTKLCQRSMT